MILSLMFVSYYFSQTRFPGAALMPAEFTFRRADLRVRPRGLRLPGHGAGHHRGGYLRSGHGQRAIGLRTEPDRSAARTSRQSIKSDFGFEPDFENAKHAARKRRRRRATRSRPRPSRCLIGTAVVGATTMVFGIIMLLRHILPRLGNVVAEAEPRSSGSHARPAHGRRGDLLVHRRVTQAVVTGAYRAVVLHQGQHQARRSKPRRSRTAKKS